MILRSDYDSEVGLYMTLRSDYDLCAALTAASEEDLSCLASWYIERHFVVSGMIYLFEQHGWEMTDGFPPPSVSASVFLIPPY